jgi:broad specificity phosphatase PhoE
MKEQNSTLYLVRHGETDFNAKKLIQGITDNPLNQNGINQAHILRQNLEGINFDAAYSSPLQRAYITTEIVINDKLPITKVFGLIERNYGKYEGSTHQEIKDHNQHLKNKPLHLLPENKIEPTFETDFEMLKRLIPELKSISQKHQGETVLIGSHMGVLRAMMIYFHKISHSDYPKIENTAYMVILGENKKLKLHEMHGVFLK